MLNQKALELFKAKFVVDPVTGCWLWTASLNRGGYGRFRDGQAHRKAYEHWKAPIPEGLDLDHLCRVRRCVNPDHLEPVTRRTNLLRGIGFVADHVRRTYCPNGHAYDGDNCMKETDRRYVRRRCRICKNSRQYAYNQRTRKGEALCWQDLARSISS